MLLTITSTTAPATDLGFLLHKHPGRLHRFELAFGTASVFYPEATLERCTACLLIEVDPIALVRRKGGPEGEGGALRQYVNDRPYVASSFLSVALAEAFGTAMGGRSKDRPELAQETLPFEVGLPVLPCRAGEGLIRELFAPLGYDLDATPLPLDPAFPEWGTSRYFSVRLRGHQRLQDLLNHLSVLIPVLDDEKHYWVGDDEVDKLLRRGREWLPTHPAKEQIVRRYLKHRKNLTVQAIERLTLDSDAEAESGNGVEGAGPGESFQASPALGREDVLEARLSLHEQRMRKVTELVAGTGAASVVDLGCGEGRLLRELMKRGQFQRLVGMDVSLRALERAHERLRLDELSPAARDRLALLHGSLMYRDRRLEGFDAATVVEVIEHLDTGRLKAFERVLFAGVRPKHIVVTTPNADYNVRFETLPAGQFRHADHRFEWTRAEFRAWAESMAERYGYGVTYDGIGPDGAEVGPPTQLALFTGR